MNISNSRKYCNNARKCYAGYFPDFEEMIVPHAEPAFCTYPHTQATHFAINQFIDKVFSDIEVFGNWVEAIIRLRTL